MNDLLRTYPFTVAYVLLCVWVTVLISILEVAR